ncbi:hotdog fold thioesterase [Leucobacter chromiireducens]|uniref:hotdog fold thioesterase n=1 Tax=Leucobacter chromiireducens TaxID=283877 RepID=UPI000F634325|nr:hotdog fold thioesterase [Leucobacter chromiireducens]
MTAKEAASTLPSDVHPDDALAYIRERGVGALADRMGIEFTEFTRERAVATMPVEGNTQPIMLMHGGAYVVLGETLGSMHANLVAPEGTVAVGVDINATHTGSARTGLVTGTCVPIKLGRSITVHEITIENEDGQRCSTVRITNFYKQVSK